MPVPSRQNFTSKVRKDALTRANGRCEAGLPSGERCPCELRPGFYRFDHIIPDRIGGAATLENCQVICVGCDAAKYHSDRPVIDRTRRIQERHEGTATLSPRAVLGSRRTPVKLKIGGGAVNRATGEAIPRRPASIDVWER